tara:strand:- start:46 stop:684 length:639 start_codon:yes stop_codon:yes gene_type:complete
MTKPLINTIYHTALKSAYETFDDVKSIKRFEAKGCVGLVNDISDGLPKEFDKCGVMFSDSPWPRGLAKFNERAGVVRNKKKKQLAYSYFSDGLRRIVEAIDTPIYITLGKGLLSKLPKAAGQAAVKLNGEVMILAWWNTEYSGPLKGSTTDTVNSLEVARYLGSQYSVMGDPMCGYGGLCLEFIAGGGKSFVAADYNGKCLSVLKARLSFGD